jgi:hypothetical protein
MKKISIVLLCILFMSASFSVFAGDKEEIVSVKAYGYIKLDALYETGRSSHGNFAIWASDPGDNDGMFYLTAKETRLGLAIKGIGFGKFKATGKLEVDFHSSGVAENKAYNYMRHAYLQISDGSLTIIAGQTWDIISPLNAATLNYPVLWGAGNIGYRRPQLSIRKDIKTGKNVFTLQAGIFRTIAADYDGDGVEDGAASGFPTVQGRIAGKFGIGKDAYLQLGLSGHYGKSKGEYEFTSDSINVDFLLVLSRKFKIVAEMFSGKNLGAFLGGIAQNVNGSTFEEIKTKGFFVNVVANPSRKVRLSIGYGMDDPDDDTLYYGYRAKNTSIFGNVLFYLSKSVKMGFEVSNWVTDYIAGDQQKTLRLQHSWILSF